MNSELTPDQIRDRVAWLKAEARKGADRLASTATTPDRAPKLTDAESAAIARHRIDRSQP